MRKDSEGLEGDLDRNQLSFRRFGGDAVAEGRLVEREVLGGDSEHSPERYATATDAAADRLRASEASEERALEWSSEFVEEVDLQKLKINGIERGWDSTKSYSRGDVEEIIQRLEEVQRLRKSGNTQGDFDRLRESTDASERLLGETERRFYSANLDPTRHSGSAVEVAWNGTSWEVEAGRHRALVAQERGMESMPAIVRAPNREMIEEIRFRR